EAEKRCRCDQDSAIQDSHHHHLMDLNDGQLAAVRYALAMDCRLYRFSYRGSGYGQNEDACSSRGTPDPQRRGPPAYPTADFHRRAAAEMTRRAALILGEARRREPQKPVEAVAAVGISWSGTFHGIEEWLWERL